MIALRVVVVGEHRLQFLLTFAFGFFCRRVVFVVGHNVSEVVFFGLFFGRDTHRHVDNLFFGDVSSLVPVRNMRLDTSNGFIDRYSHWSDTAELLGQLHDALCYNTVLTQNGLRAAHIEQIIMHQQRICHHRFCQAVSRVILPVNPRKSNAFLLLFLLNP